VGDNEKYSIVMLRRLFVLEREHSPELIAAVLTEDDELKSSLLPELGLLPDGELLDIVCRHIEAAKREFGDPKTDPSIDDHIAALVVVEDPAFEGLEKRFSELHDFLKNDRKYLRKLDEDELANFLPFPTWRYELFAALSMGRRPTLTKIDPDIDYPIPVVEEFNRRIRLMEMANKLPEGHPEHLRTVSTPHELIGWALKGPRFDVHAPLAEWAQIPTYSQLKEENAATKKKVAELLDDQIQLKSGALRKKIASLQHICMILACCISREPSGDPKPLYDPDGKKKPRLIRTLQDHARLIIASSDVPDDDTIRTHLRDSFAALSEVSKKHWRIAVNS
jgi:hypothetical protein